jgi:hypothetical protein
MPSSIYWDSCLFIEVLQKTNTVRLDALKELLAKAKRATDPLRIVTSSYTIVEVQPFTGRTCEKQGENLVPD